MTDDQHSDAEPPQLQYFVSSGGMALVALVCAASGLAFGLDRQLSWTVDRLSFAYVAAYAALAFPYFYGRYASLEGLPPSRRRLSDGRFVPFLLFVPLLTIFVLWSRSNVPPQQWRTLTAPLALSLGVFVYIWIRMLVNLQIGGEWAEQERYFKNKVLLPAFCTCLVSFSYGWTLSHPTRILDGIIAPIVLIIVGREFIAARRVTWAVFFISATIICAFIFSVVSGSDVANVILVGTILTLAMGVAEVCKRVVWIRRKEPILGVVVGSEDAEFYLAGSNWASVMFPLLLCLVPLLVPSLTVIPIFLVLSAQYTHWHFFARKKISLWLIPLNIFLGLSLPLVLLFEHVVALPDLFQKLPLGDLFGFIAIYLAFYGFGLATMWPAKVQEFLSNIFKRRAYLVPENCFLFYLTVALFLVALIGFVALITDSRAMHFQSKARETIIYLLILTVIATVLRWLPGAMLWPPQPPKKGDAEMNTTTRYSVPIRRVVIPAVLLVTKVARLPVAVITGIPAAVLLALHTHLGTLEISVVAFPIVATTMTGFLLNDIYDLKRDNAAGRNKALAMGAVSSRSAIILAAILSIAGLIISFEDAKGESFYIVALALAGVLLYSSIARAVPTTKGLVTAILCCAPFAYASAVSGVAVPIQCYPLVLAFIFGRELLLDVRDLSADRSAGIYTLAEFLKPSLSQAIGWLLMAASLVIAVISTKGLAEAFLFGGLISLGICFLLYLRDKNLGIGSSRVTLLIGAVGAMLVT